MKINLILVTSLIITMLFSNSTISEAQLFLSPELLSNGGGMDISTQYVLTYSIGEPITGNINSEGLILTQGFQQPESTATGIVDKNEIEIKLYPNPFSDQFILEFTGIPVPFRNIEIAIFDVLGNFVLQKDSYLYSNQVLINISNFASGTYFIKIVADYDIIFQSKIIKP